MMRTTGLLLSTTALAGGFCGLVSAQQAPPNTSLSEVVVTAQKRTEKLQDVPISMVVVSREKIAGYDIKDFKGLVRFTPNVEVVQSVGNDVIYIRGFGSQTGNYSFDQSVSLYLDGVYAGRSKQTQSPFFDLERVEVLRGPQGALFGKNTAAGAISIVSAGPTDHFEAAATARYNFEQAGPDFEGYVSGPLTSTVSARVAIKLVDQDGWIKNLDNGNLEPKTRSGLARLTLRWAPTSTFDYTLKTEYDSQTLVGDTNVSSQENGPADPQTFRYAAPNRLGRDGTTTNSWLVSGTGNLRLGDYTLTSITGFSYYKANMLFSFDQEIPGGGGAVDGNNINVGFPDRFEQVSQEVRLASLAGQRLEYTVGAYYDASRYTLQELPSYAINSPPVLVYNGNLESYFSQRSQTYSVFGQGTFHVVDRLRLIGSLRYTHNAKRGFYNSELISGPFPLSPLTSAVGSISEDNLDPSATIQFDLTPRIMAYATYARGSKSGGFVSNTFGTTNADFTYRPERSQNYEAGVKSTLDGGRVVLDASIYDTSFKDLQVSSFDGATLSQIISNAASATSKGVEVSAAWYPAKGLDFTASGAYQDPKYDNYPGAACLASQPTCNPVTNNIRGTQLPYASKASITFQAHYRVEMPGDSALDATMNVSARSKYFTNADLSPFYATQDAYGKLDARLSYAPNNQRWHVAVIGQNLTNEKTVSSSFTVPFPVVGVSRALLALEPTRNIAIEAGVKF